MTAARVLLVAALAAALAPSAFATETPPMPNAPPARDPPPDRGCADVPECAGWTFVRVAWAQALGLRHADYAIDEALRQTTWADRTQAHLVNCHVLQATSCWELAQAHTPAGTVYVPVGLSTPGVWRESNGCPGWQPGPGGCGGRPADERLL